MSWLIFDKFFTFLEFEVWTSERIKYVITCYRSKMKCKVCYNVWNLLKELFFLYFGSICHLFAATWTINQLNWVEIRYFTGKSSRMKPHVRSIIARLVDSISLCISSSYEWSRINHLFGPIIKDLSLDWSINHLVVRSCNKLSHLTAGKMT